MPEPTAVPEKLRRIVILGNLAVGKSSLTLQFIENNFPTRYYPTIEHTFTKTLTHHSTPYLCEIIDTAGQDEFTTLQSHYAIGVHGYILVYNVASHGSLDGVKVIRDKILNLVGEERIPVVLVGNKTDLVGQREVTEEEGRDVARQWGCRFTESSAKQGENVDEIFSLMIAEIEKDRESASSEHSRCSLM